MSGIAMTTLNLDELVLQRGTHEAASHQMCVMEAVAYVAGEPWTDRPKCASPVIAEFLRSYNDCVDDDVRQTLKPLIPLMVNTRGSVALETVRANMAADWMVRVYAPTWLRLAGLDTHADALSGLAELTTKHAFKAVMPSLLAVESAALAAMYAAKDASRLAVRDAMAAAAGLAAWAAMWAGARAGARAAGEAARDAAWNAAATTWCDKADAADTLTPLTLKLQATVIPLIKRMIAATDPAVQA